MSEMIEEVAKAIWDVRRAHANKAGIWLEFWGDGSIPKENGIMEEARAAIEAMRDLPGDPGPRYTAGEYSRRTQEAMVDDALGGSQVSLSNHRLPEPFTRRQDHPKIGLLAGFPEAVVNTELPVHPVSVVSLPGCG